MVFDGDRELRYNARNQLTHVSMRNEKRVDYEYDYTGARVKKRVEYTDAYARFHQKETHYLGDALEIKEGNLLIISTWAVGRLQRGAWDPCSSLWPWPVVL
jgi:YD repeat-containing protein